MFLLGAAAVSLLLFAVSACSTAAVAVSLPLSLVADAPSVAADRSTAVVDAASVVGVVAATDSYQHKLQ